MLSMQTAAERRAGRVAAAVVLLALAACAAFVLVPGADETLTTLPPEARLAAPDELRSAAKDDPTSFLAERDQVELRVSAPTTLREFLDRNRLNKPNQSRQIMEQLGSTDPAAVIPAGRTFRIRLTPSAPDVPGTSARTAT
jgi:hypothetical protein